MDIVVLGSGTANPHPTRSSAGFWIDTGKGTIMLDFSASALHRLAQEHLDWANIDSVWISHFHLDHCCGLPAYLFATRHAAETRERRKPLRIFGAKGLRKLIATFDEAGGGKLLQQPFPVEVVEIESLASFDILPGVTAIAYSTPHKTESHAIRIEDPSGAVLVYTSDTGFGKDIAAFAKSADLFITESSFLEKKESEIHLELAEAIYLINRAKPKLAMLTHLYADWDNVDFEKEVSRFDPACQIIEATDGLRLKIPD